MKQKNPERGSLGSSFVSFSFPPRSLFFLSVSRALLLSGVCSRRAADPEKNWVMRNGERSDEFPNMYLASLSKCRSASSPSRAVQSFKLPQRCITYALQINFGPGPSRHSSALLSSLPTPRDKAMQEPLANVIRLKTEGNERILSARERTFHNRIEKISLVFTRGTRGDK